MKRTALFIARTGRKQVRSAIKLTTTAVNTMSNEYPQTLLQMTQRSRASRPIGSQTG